MKSDLINWGELSRLLSGNRQSIQKNKIPKKYQESVKRLTDFIDSWKKEKAT